MRRKDEPKYIYMLVTDDKFELPIITAESARELAERAGVDKNTVFVQTWKQETGRVERSRYVRVRIEEDEDDEQIAL